MKIFVSIASFQDPILPYTIDSIIKNAKYKDDLVLGVFDQSKDILKDLPDNVRYKTCDPEDAKGACWARSKIQTDLYEGEEIFMQIDSHTLFEKDWDKNLLEKYNNCLEWFDKPIITGYPRAFDVITPKGGFFNTDQEYIFRVTTDDPDQTHVMTMHLPFSQGYHSGQVAHVIPGKKYYRGFALSAGLIFTEGNFVKEIPYDPEIYFAGEETTLALRAFTHGYDLVHVPNTPLYHWYNSDDLDLKRELHWNMAEASPELKIEKDLRIEMAEEKVNEVLQGNTKGKYGLGDKRTLKEYAELSGVDYERKMYQKEKATFKYYENGGLEIEETFE
jgi:hypothetical protein